MMHSRCKCCGQVVDVSDLEAAIERADLSNFQRLIVQALLSTKGKWLPAERLIFALWGNDIDGGPDDAEGTLHSHISKTRSKLADMQLRIESARHYGYRIVFDEKPVISEPDASQFAEVVPQRQPNLSAYNVLRARRRARSNAALVSIGHSARLGARC